VNSEVRIRANQIQITRVLDAPRPLVFSFWTTAEKLQQWSTCKEAIGCQVVMDFRVGGSFTQKMQLRVNGETCEIAITGTYDEIVEPEKIVYRADFGFVFTRATIEFFEQGKGTKVVVTHEGCPDEFFGQDVSRGTADSFEKLDSLVAAQPVGLPL
jgi:uncharacterized protein YndB with AHSA1/START domain